MQHPTVRPIALYKDQECLRITGQVLAVVEAITPEGGKVSA